MGIGGLGTHKKRSPQLEQEFFYPNNCIGPCSTSLKKPFEIHVKYAILGALNLGRYF
jgi:hypothetical protein